MVHDFMNLTKIAYSKVVKLNYFRLAYRSLLLILGAIVYVKCLVDGNRLEISFNSNYKVLLCCVWFIFFIEMIFRLVPSKLESPGSQKHFKKNYIKTGKTDIGIQDNNAVLLVGLLWLSLNVLFGCLKFLGVLDDGFMFLLFLLFSICDMICILYFCPFQTFFLKNRCCVHCRIYNWDYAMMLSPMFFVIDIYSWSLVFLAIIILFKWEITFYKHPERFSRNTNTYLACENCSETLCKNKKHLNKIWIKFSEYKKRKLDDLKK